MTYNRKNTNSIPARSNRPLRFLLLLMMTVVSVVEAWGQDLSGTYYISNNASYNIETSATNWYLVPAKDPKKAHYADAYFNNQYCNDNSDDAKGDYTGDNYGDPEQPFLTTYQTNREFQVEISICRRWLLLYYS